MISLAYISGVMATETVYCQFLQYLVVFCNHIDEPVNTAYHFTHESMTFGGFSHKKHAYYPCKIEIKFDISYAEI